MLGVTAKFALGAVAAAGCARTTGNACVDLERLTDSERAMRKSLAYMNPSRNQEQACAKCSFFTASAESCGTCSILNGAVSATGHCSSWAAAS
jgi:hypothetical protein